MSIRFDEDDVRAMGRAARGVRGVSLAKDDKVIGVAVVGKESKETILIVTEKGLRQTHDRGRISFAKSRRRRPNHAKDERQSRLRRFRSRGHRSRSILLNTNTGQVDSALRLLRYLGH